MRFITRILDILMIDDQITMVYLFEQAVLVNTGRTVGSGLSLQNS